MSHLIDKSKNLEDMSYAELLKEGNNAGSSDYGTKILGVSGGAVSAVTGSLAIIGEEFGEELLSGLGGGAFIGIGFMIYRFFKVSQEIESQIDEEPEKTGEWTLDSGDTIPPEIKLDEKAIKKLKEENEEAVKNITENPDDWSNTMNKIKETQSWWEKLLLWIKN
jgi:hypothetical protein